MWYNICNKQKTAFASPPPPPPTHTHTPCPMLLNPPPRKVIFHAIYPELSVALQEVALMQKKFLFYICT